MLGVRYKFVDFGAVIDSRLVVTTRADDAKGTFTQSHISPRILSYEEKAPGLAVRPNQTGRELRISRKTGI